MRHATWWRLGCIVLILTVALQTTAGGERLRELVIDNGTGDRIIYYDTEMADREYPSLITPDEPPPLTLKMVDTIPPLLAFSVEEDVEWLDVGRGFLHPQPYRIDRTIAWPARLFTADRRPTPHAGGMFQRLPDGRFLWVARLFAEDWSEHFLDVVLDRANMPAGSTLWAFGSRRTSYEASSPFSLEGSGLANSGMIRGPQVYIEIVFPADAALHPPFNLTLLFVRPSFRLQHSGQSKVINHPFACFRDATCVKNARFPGIRQYARGVALIQHPLDGMSCTGSLIKNHKRKPKKGVSYILTAGHCAKSADHAKELNLYFNFRSEKCGENAPSPDDIHEPNRVVGVKLAMRWYHDPDDPSFHYWNKDLALLEVKTNKLPPDVYYFDWKKEEMFLLDREVGIRLSHPGAGFSVMPLSYSESIKYSRGTSSPCQCGNSIDFTHSRRRFGDVDHGSSGSLLLNKRGFIVGHLRGGCNCHNDSLPPACREGEDVNTQVDTNFYASITALDSFLDDRSWPRIWPTSP